MELGGNIELVGFSDEDQSDLVIIKKIVGNFTKEMTSSHDDFSRLVITSLPEKGKRKLHGALVIGDSEYAVERSDKNLYFALDAILKELAVKAAA